MAGTGRHPLFLPLVVAGGLVEGFGLAYSQMARPEIVLSFLRLQDFGLLLVMLSASLVVGVAVFVGTRYLDGAPLTGRDYVPRRKDMDSNVVLGGVVFGVGWGLSGICPGAAYASLGVGNLPILWGLAGMFLGAYVQGYLRSGQEDRTEGTVTAD